MNVIKTNGLKTLKQGLKSYCTAKYPSPLSTILFEKRSEGVAVITLNRPAQLNALNRYSQINSGFDISKASLFFWLH